MRPGRRGFLSAAAGVPLAVAATAAAAQGQGGAAPSRGQLADRVARDGAIPGGLHFDGTHLYVGRAGARAIPDLPGLVPQGRVEAGHFGVVAGDRAASRTNVAALSAALDWCRAEREPLYLPAGSVFLADRVDVTGVTVEGRGLSTMNYLARHMSTALDTAPAPSQIVLTAEAVTPIRIYGISSMQACGAARRFADPRPGLLEERWKMVSLTDRAEPDGPGRAASLSVGLVIENGSGTVLRDFRVLVDGGGPDGLDAYNDAGVSRILGDVDIGILQLGGHLTTLERVQCMGHFRRYGYLVAAVDRDGDFSDYSAPYETSVIRCGFQGMRAVGIRGPDKFAILDHGSSWVELPWADDHPFTLDANQNVLRLTDTGTGTSAGAGYRYDRVRRVERDGAARIRLEGMDGFDPGRWGAVTTARAGGANSHIVLRDCQIGGLAVPAGWAANDAEHVEGAIDNGAIGGFEISGWRSAEADIHGRIQHPGTVMGLIHETRETVLDVMCEASPTRNRPPAATWIVSPQHNENEHAAHPVGGPRWLDWRYAMVTERSASGTDFAPFLDFMPRPSLFADRPGWFQGYWALRAPQIRYRYDRSGTQNYMAAPALSIGPEAEGYRGQAPSAPLEVAGQPVVGSGGALRFAPVARDALADAEHPVNRSGKAAGVAVFEAGGGRVLVATGPEPRDPWRAMDGSDAIRPR